MPVIRFTGTVSSDVVSSLGRRSSLNRSVTRILLVTEYNPPPLYSSALAVSCEVALAAYRSLMLISYVNILNPGSRTPMIPSSSPMPASSSGRALITSTKSSFLSYVFSSAHTI